MPVPSVTLYYQLVVVRPHVPVKLHKIMSKTTIVAAFLLLISGMPLTLAPHPNMRCFCYILSLFKTQLIRAYYHIASSVVTILRKHNLNRAKYLLVITLFSESDALHLFAPICNFFELSCWREEAKVLQDTEHKICSK